MRKAAVLKEPDHLTTRADDDFLPPWSGPVEDWSCAQTSSWSWLALA